MTTKLIQMIRTRNWEGKTWLDNFIHVNSNEESSEKIIRTAIQDYLNTPDGKKAVEHTNFDFNWGDALNEIPQSHWAKYDLSLVYEGDVHTFDSMESILVDQDEVLCKDSSSL